METLLRGELQTWASSYGPGPDYAPNYVPDWQADIVRGRRSGRLDGSVDPQATLGSQVPQRPQESLS